MTLDEYKALVKKENLVAFYRNKIDRTYTRDAIIDSLIGISGAAPIGTIRAFINQVKIDEAAKKAEIDAATSIAAINAILGVMKHD